MLKLYVYKGYKGTVKDICLKYCLNYNTVKSRMRRGFSLEDAIEKPGGKKSAVRLRERCEDSGINYETVRARIRSGMTEEEALLTPLAFSTASGYFEYNGIRCKVITKMCRLCGVSYQTIHNYMKSGLSFEESMDKALGLKKRYKH